MRMSKFSYTGSTNGCVALLYHHESTRADPQKLVEWLETVIKGDELGRLL